MRNFPFFPLPRVFPISTFPKRLLNKIGYIWITLSWSIRSQTGYTNALVIGKSSSGNTLIELRHDVPLGKKSETLLLPADEVIFKSVVMEGSWELEVSTFLAKNLNLINSQIGPSALGGGVALLDIGANVGAIALQTLLISGGTNTVVLIEPIPQHVEAIQHNFLKLKELNSVIVFDFALSDTDGQATMYRETSNAGNTSMYLNLMREEKYEYFEIRLVETKKFLTSELANFDGFILKSDTQGMDALILSQFTPSFWSKISAAVIEVWALPDVKDEHVRQVIENLGNFNFIGWTADQSQNVDLSELSQFWLNKSSKAKNLYISRFVL